MSLAEDMETAMRGVLYGISQHTNELEWYEAAMEALSLLGEGFNMRLHELREEKEDE